MAKLRHVALYAEDAIAAAHFYRDAFDMEIVRESANACSLTDGIMNVTIIKSREGFPAGIHHFGMWVDDLEKGQAQAVAAGAIFHQGPPPEGQAPSRSSTRRLTARRFSTSPIPAGRVP
jgi:catechol 2,3-dioxygenase-like lactoylglutathione lyase family enzyme